MGLNNALTLKLGTRTTSHVRVGLGFRALGLGFRDLTLMFIPFPMFLSVWFSIVGALYPKPHNAPAKQQQPVKSFRGPIYQIHLFAYVFTLKDLEKDIAPLKGKPQTPDPKPLVKPQTLQYINTTPTPEPVNL